VSRPVVPCSTSTGTGTRLVTYAALDEDVSARVSSKYLGGAAIQTIHSADWAVAPVLEQVQTHTQQAAPANKGISDWPVVPAPLRTSDGVTAKLTRQHGKKSTSSSSSTLQNALMSGTDVVDDSTAPTDSYLAPGQRSPSPTPLQPTQPAAERFERELQQISRQQEPTSAARVTAWLYPPAPATPHDTLQQPGPATPKPRPLPHAPVAGSASPRLLAPATTTAATQPVLPPDLATLHDTVPALSRRLLLIYAGKTRYYDTSWQQPVHTGLLPPQQCLGLYKGHYRFHGIDVRGQQQITLRSERQRGRETLDAADIRRRPLLT